MYQLTDTPVRPRVDLRPWASPVDDQYELGSCTANAIVNAYELMTNQSQPGDAVDLSRLFVYYNAREDNGDVDNDTGIFVRTGLKAVKALGTCTEALWPYDITQFAAQPDPVCYQDALSRTIASYTRIKTVDDMIDALNNNRPVVFGISIYNDFYDLTRARSTVAMPGSGEDLDLGGHAMCMVGYDLDRKLFLAKNSFGTDWGDQGYCWIPFEYIDTEGYDMWVFDLPTS